MKKAKLINFALMPTFVMTLVGCGNKTSVTGLSVKTKNTICSVGNVFNNNDLIVTATYSDKTTKEIKEGFTVEPNLPYTFQEEDVVNGKDFEIKVGDKSSSLHINVVAAPTSEEAQFTFKNYDDTVLQITNIKKGDSVSYSGDLPQKPIEDKEITNMFLGWEPKLGIASENKTFTAQYKKIDQYVDQDHDGIPEGIDKDDSDNEFEVGAKSFVYLNQRITIDFTKFLENEANTKYDNELAKLGLFMSNPKVDFDDGLFDDKEFGGRNNALYSRLGFDDFHHFDFKDEAANNYKYDFRDTTSGVYGHKYLLDKDGKIAKDLIVIAFEGTNGKNRWYSNFDVGYDNADYYDKTGGKDAHPEWTDKRYHKGFYVAAKRVIADTVEGKNGTLPGPVRLLDYIEKHSSYSNGKPIIFITGHSRGGAMANILGQYFENEYRNEDGSQKCIPFTYTFASPSPWGATNPPNTQTIFNIVNTDDMVPMVPHQNWGFTRIGTDVISKSIKDNKNYLDAYNANREKREYQRIEGASSIFANLGCTARDQIYNLNNDNKYLSTAELATYNTEEDAKAGLAALKKEYEEALGDFSKFYELKIIKNEATSLYDEYYAIQANCCLGTLTSVIQNIMAGDSQFLYNITYWLQIVKAPQFKEMLFSLLPNIVAGGTDTVGLPHDYGAYQILLKFYHQ